MEEKEGSKWGILYNKSYKLLLAISLIIFVLAILSIYSFYQKTGDIMNKDVSLTGGTSITVTTSEKIDTAKLEQAVEPKVGDIDVRIISDLRTREQIAFTVESKANLTELNEAVESYLGYKLNEENSSKEFTGNSLSKSFYSELMRAMALAFLLMAVVIFALFRMPLPSFYIVFCATFDILVPLAITDLIGIKISTAGIAAFLMLIGYSVDTDILLTTRTLKRREGAVNERIFSAFKTGVTMTLTSLVAVLFAYFIVISPVLKQIFLILSFGLIADLIGTWFMNASLIKWYCEKRNI